MSLALRRPRCARCFDAGGKLLALGNGGSATDAMDVVADFRARRAAGRPPALDLTEDPAILTAIANDIGTEAIFQRQVIAYGRPGRRAARALDERQLGERDPGAGGGARAGCDDRVRRLRRRAVAAERLADHVIVTRSQHIPRIQEAQASAYHVLRELVERRAVTAPARRACAPRRGDGPGRRLPPFVHRLAGELGLAGWVLNDERGVLLEAEGARRGGRRASRAAGRARRRRWPRVERVRRGASRRPGERGLRDRRQRARRRARARSSRRTPRPATTACASCSTRPTAATATRSSTAPTAARASRSSAACPTTGR